MLVSVIIPTYNRLSFLNNAIKSVLNQTYTNFEIIVINDNSDDGTNEFLEKFNNSKIKYIRNDKTLYAPASRNIGVAKAKGDLVAFLDDDDEWYPNKLEDQVKLFADKTIGLVYGGVDLFFEDYNLFYSTKPILKGKIYNDMLMKNYIGATPSVIIRKVALKDICNESNEYFDISFPARQDYDLWIRISKIWKVDYIQKPVLKQNYRNSINRISRNINNHINAHVLLDKKYKLEISSCLSTIQKKNRLINQFLFLAAQSIKINNTSIARKYYFQAFKIDKSLKIFLMFLSTIFGSRLIIMLRCYFK
jgi:glycosyltransferase involved in cell wall biosynthesis